MEKGIVIIVCYFGKLPWYFGYFLHSCKYNPSVQFYIITDNNLCDNVFPENVTYIQKSLREIKNDFSSTLGFEVGLESPYKFCDLRPALSCVFPEIVKTYDFWGYGDIDVIYGNIREFITDNILENYDVVSVRHDYLPGAFSLFKNNERINELFKESKDYLKVFTDPKHYCFDETNFTFDEFAKGVPYREIESEVESMTHVVRRMEDKKEIKAYFDFHVIEGLPGRMKWNKGTLIYGNGIEAILYHMIKLKDVYFPTNIPKEIPDSFRISSTRIY